MVDLMCITKCRQRVEAEGPRGVNRHRYSYEEAAAELQRPVVKALHAMCRLRNRHPAFNGKVETPFLMQDPFKIKQTCLGTSRIEKEKSRFHASFCIVLASMTTCGRALVCGRDRTVHIFCAALLFPTSFQPALLDA